jgi:hypothetical protein
VGETGDEMVAQRHNKDLSLMFQPTEGFAVDNTVAVSLKGGTDRVRFFIFLPTLGTATFYGIRG